MAYVYILGAEECLTCPAGYMCTRRFIADPCKQGFYCPKGTGFNIQPCPPGTFGSRDGLIEKVRALLLH